MAVRVLYIGEIVGKAGVYCVKKLLPKLKDERKVDFVIANAEGATGGFGLGKNHSVYLHKLGIDVLTGGECIYYKKDIVEHIDRVSFILRPANYPPGNPGLGWRVYRQVDPPIAVVVMLGLSGFTRVHLSNPFTYLPELVQRINQHTPLILLDFHASATAEKYAMFHHADSKVSAVVGSHTKIMTADAQIFPGGTATICDAGRTGSQDSVVGLNPDIEIRKFLTQIPERSQDSWKRLELQAVLIDIEDNGQASNIETVCVHCPDPEEHVG